MSVDGPALRGRGVPSGLSRAIVAFLAAVITVALLPALPTLARGPVKVVSREVATSVERQRVVELPLVASHVALHWRGEAEARLSVAFSAHGRAFGEALVVEHDEAGAASADGRTYGSVMWTGGAKFVRVVSDRPLAQLTVVAIDSVSGGRSAAGAPVVSAAVDQPSISSRAGWGADESIRFDAEGNELWPREFQPVQKLIVHHTVTGNSDPDPEATVRAIYHFHAVTRGWGDIGYNFLIDEAGRIYEGRYSRPYGEGEVPTGEDEAGNSVTGAHVGGYNSGTVGIALLGDLREQDATPAARAALEWLLAWKADRHGVDPLGSGVYTNPVTGVQKDVANIAAHRNYAATECPGETFYRTMGSLREAVAARMAEPPGTPILSARTADRPGVRLTWSVPPDGGSPITAYRVLRLKKDRFVRIATVSASRTAYRDSTTTSGRTYTYVVRAVNAVGAGPRSNEASAAAR